MDAKLIRQGEPIDALMFVLDGKVSVEVEGIGQVASLGSGEMLGEPVCVIRAQRPAQVGPAKFRVIAAAVAA